MGEEHWGGMDFGVHLPLIDLTGAGFSQRRLADTVDAAREFGFSAVSANDHLLFSTAWLDGPTALASVVERSGPMKLATTLSLASLRGPVPTAKALVALDILSGGRVIAGVGPGSSKADYEAAGVPFEERWRRFDECLRRLRALLRPPTDTPPSSAGTPAGLSPTARQEGGIPIWIGSWGSAPGIRRVARLGDGWFASAYNTTPADFAANLRSLGEELERRGRSPEAFPHGLVTMWTWVTDDGAEAERMISDVLSPIVRRDPADLRARVCIGSAESCADLLSRYLLAGCRWVQFWPLGDERRQIERLAREVMPRVAP